MNSRLARSSRRAFLGTLATGAALFTTPRPLRRGTGPHPADDRGAVLPRQAAARHRQRPDHRQRRHHPGRRRDHPPDRPGARRRAAARSATRRSRSGSATPTQVYLHTGDSDGKKDQQDKNFQGFGRFTTGSTGEYYFRTIKPVPYPGRPAPHIHFKVKKGGRELLTTQFIIAGHPGNEVDGVVRGGIGVFDRELLLVDFKPIKDSKIGELRRALRDRPRPHPGRAVLRAGTRPRPADGRGPTDRPTRPSTDRGGSHADADRDDWRPCGLLAAASTSRSAQRPGDGPGTRRRRPTTSWPG